VYDQCDRCYVSDLCELYGISMISPRCVRSVLCVWFVWCVWLFIDSTDVRQIEILGCHLVKIASFLQYTVSGSPYGWAGVRVYSGVWRCLLNAYGSSPFYCYHSYHYYLGCLCNNRTPTWFLVTVVSAIISRQRDFSEISSAMAQHLQVPSQPQLLVYQHVI